jgi:hypothetical protein
MAKNQLMDLLKQHFGKGDEMDEEIMPRKKNKKKKPFDGDEISDKSPFMYDDEDAGEDEEGFEENEYDQSEENEDEDEAEGYDNDGEYGEYDEDEDSGEDEDGLMPRSRMPKNRRKDLAVAVISKKMSKAKRKAM